MFILNPNCTKAYYYYYSSYPLYKLSLDFNGMALITKKKKKNARSIINISVLINEKLNITDINTYNT